MASAKWVGELTAETPVADAARRVLSVRLKRVREFLAEVQQEPDREPEQIHQLRVGTRRARAALDIFAACLSDKNYRQAKKQLRKLRRGAGAARDWDVFLQSVRDFASNKSARAGRAGLDYLIGFGMGQRLAVQGYMTEQLPRVRALDRLRASVLRELRPTDNGPATLLELACPTLRRLLDELDQSATQDLSVEANLHRVRISGKRLRYAMEVFACCFADEFRSRHYVAVKEMQEILGRANDSQSACARLDQIRVWNESLIPTEWKRYRASFEKLRSYHAQRVPLERRNFDDWWQRWQKTGGKSALLALLRLPGD